MHPTSKRADKLSKHKNFNLNRLIVNHLRQLWRYWPPRQEALSAAKAGGFYLCGKCRKLKDKHHVQVDHIIPVGGFQGDWNSYIRGLFCEGHNLEVLCVECHKEKTLAEGIARRQKNL